MGDKQVGTGRTVSVVAKELSCDWGVVNKVVTIYGRALLDADSKRLKDTSAMGLNETLFRREDKFKAKSWCTGVADLSNHQLIDILPTRNYVEVAGWIDYQPSQFKSDLVYGALDMSATYAADYSVALSKVIHVVDKFHLIKLANQVLDSTRPRVQVEQLSHRGTSKDPRNRSRKLLLMRSNHLDKAMGAKLESLLELGDPNVKWPWPIGSKRPYLTFMK